MTTLERPGTSVCYRCSGPPAATAVLFSHGFSATSSMWSATIAALSPDYRCIAWDQRGHGASGYPAEPEKYSAELAIEDMAAILDAEGVDRAVLAGHSLGGYLSMRFHQRRPERVAALVLADTGPGYRSAETRAGWNEMCETYAKGLEADGLAGLPVASPELGSAEHRDASGLVMAARYVLTQQDSLVVDHLPAIDVPTLLLVGSKDRPYLSGTDYMAAKIPGARKVVIDGAGHAPMITHGDAFESEVRRFLEDLGSA